MAGHAQKEFLGTTGCKCYVNYKMLGDALFSMGNCHSFTEFFRLKFGKKDTLLGLENEHCIKMIFVDATINGSVSDVTGGLNSTIMDISHAFYHFKWVYSPAEELNISNEACNSVYRKCFCIF